MTTYILRDAKLLPPDDDRFAAMTRVRAKQGDPKATAESFVAAGQYPYIQFLYDGEFTTETDRMSFWGSWMAAFLSELHALAGSMATRLVSIEHPSLGWDHVLNQAVRHTERWQEIFVPNIDRISEITGATVAQFGVPTNSPVLYQLPWPSNVARVEEHAYGAAWINLPHQWAFNRHTSRDEFTAALALCQALKVPNVILWSDAGGVAAAAMAQAVMPWVLDRIETIDRARSSSEPLVGQWRAEDTWETFMARHAPSRGRG